MEIRMSSNNDNNSPTSHSDQEKAEDVCETLNRIDQDLKNMLLDGRIQNIRQYAKCSVQMMRKALNITPDENGRYPLIIPKIPNPKNQPSASKSDGSSKTPVPVHIKDCFETVLLNKKEPFAFNSNTKDYKVDDNYIDLTKALIKNQPRQTSVDEQSEGKTKAEAPASNLDFISDDKYKETKRILRDILEANIRVRQIRGFPHQMIESNYESDDDDDDNIKAMNKLVSCVSIDTDKFVTTSTTAKMMALRRVGMKKKTPKIKFEIYVPNAKVNVFKFDTPYPY